MIRRIEISGIKGEKSEDLEKYVTKKLSSLDKYIPKSARGSAHAEVIFRETKIKNKKQCTCEAIIYLPSENLTAKESTMNMFASVDIVQQKLKVQLKKYKETHISKKAGRKDSKVRSFLGKISSRQFRP